MLNQLDTLIGFVVVMSIVSLLIMVATQAVSSSLGLRGKNLADGLEVLFHKIEPAIDRGSCRHLIDEILTSPVISDSVLSVKKADGFFVKYVPFVRELRLRWMRATAVRPDELFDMIKEKARTPLATSVDLLSDMETQLANLPAALVQNDPAKADQVAKARDAVHSAITAIESHAAYASGLNGLPAPQAPVPESLAAACDAFTAAVGPVAGHSENASDAAKAFTKAWTQFESDAKRRAALASAVAANSISKVLVASAAAAAAAAAQAAATAGNLETEIKAEAAQFEKWFNSAQDRAQQWFTMHARIVTVIGAIVAAFVLQLDTVQMVKLLAANPDLRSKLVAQADSLDRQAQALGQQKVTVAMHQQALAEIKDANPTWTVPTDPLGSGADANIAQARAWLEAHLGSNEHAADISFLYEQNLRRQALSENENQFKGVLNDYNLTSLQLMPDPYPIEYNSDWKPSAWWHSPFVPWTPVKTPRIYWSWPFPHLMGILLSAALLSLGGPFWFNLLNQLSSLRPALADAVDGQPKQGAVAPVPPKS
jgi:hypothetical protein